jgi:hypothetical protein
VTQAAEAAVIIGSQGRFDAGLAHHLGDLEWVVHAMRHGVWLYYRFILSYRDVQELLFERGIDVSHEAIRQWYRKFGQDYANRLRRRRPQPGDKWYLGMVSK